MRSLHSARFGGTEGNEILTSATAWVLVGLLAAEGFTIVNMHGLVGAHMFIGMVLIPPVVLKLASTGYRFARYYTGARAYRRKGPPLLPLRLMAPVLVASTVAVFVTGVLLLAAGHKSGTLLELHKLSFIVWAVVFAVHFLAYLPRIVRSLRADWVAARRRAVPGTGARALLVVAAVGGGTALALSLLPAITAWHGGR
jgi:cytochrome b